MGGRPCRRSGVGDRFLADQGGRWRGGRSCGRRRDYGMATAGYRSTATAGDYGTATAGYDGTATAGDYGTVTAGDRSMATAGMRHGDRRRLRHGDRRGRRRGDRRGTGTATAGYGGTATAGDTARTAGERGTATAGTTARRPPGTTAPSSAWWDDKSPVAAGWSVRSASTASRPTRRTRCENGRRWRSTDDAGTNGTQAAIPARSPRTGRRPTRSHLPGVRAGHHRLGSGTSSTTGPVSSRSVSGSGNLSSTRRPTSSVCAIGTSDHLSARIFRRHYIALPTEGSA